MNRTPNDATVRRIWHGTLHDWFRSNARILAWRQDRDPYRIWLSEVMLQQTRVDQAGGYFDRFLARFPTLEVLAGADIDEVLRLWEGLGYYARARNLHKAAREMIDKYGGVPSDPAHLRALPGIGEYTAAAVLSIAFDAPYAAVDGNVTRVLARAFAVDTDVRTSAARRHIAVLAQSVLDANHPGLHNQAMMELGASICLPKSPRCSRCPIQSACAAFAQGAPERYPVKSRRPPIPHYDVVVALVGDAEGRLLITRRPEDAMLGGLWEFPGGKRGSEESLQEACRRELREELGIDVEVGAEVHSLSHAYTHFRITLHAYRCRLVVGHPAPKNGMPAMWVHPDELPSFAFPRANRRLIETLMAGEPQARLSHTDIVA